jgi:hypothetical protein
MADGSYNFRYGSGKLYVRYVIKNDGRRCGLAVSSQGEWNIKQTIFKRRVSNEK